MFDGLSDGPEALSEAQAAKLAEEQRIEDTRLIMRDAAGRRFVYETILELGGFDPVHGERGAGRHEAALHIIARVKEAGVAYYHTMIRENEK